MTESLCVLYVAMTRAIHGLYMIIPPHGSKSLPRTFSGLLRATLHGTGPVPPAATLYQEGDPRWFEKAGAPQPAAAVAPPQRPLPTAVTLAPVSPTRLSGETVSPSSLAGGAVRKVADLLELETASALVRGTVIHAWFERIGWLDDGRPSPDRLLRVAQRYNTANLDLEELLSSFAGMLAWPQIAGLFSRNRYQPPWEPALRSLVPSRGGPFRAEVHAERTFAFRDDGQLIQGAIDRLVLVYDDQRLVAAEVIDFKTDQLAADDPQAVARKVAYYGPQLNAYRAAVARTFGLPPAQVAAHVAFVSAGLVASVPPE
ncbi:MAG: hypothetical protein GTO03_09825 [Planctomycetales bacterium]|nr:hypothetical protein [Planctomycetales bacterium]